MKETIITEHELLNHFCEVWSVAKFDGLNGWIKSKVFVNLAIGIEFNLN